MTTLHGGASGIDVETMLNACVSGCSRNFEPYVSAPSVAITTGIGNGVEHLGTQSNSDFLYR